MRELRAGDIVALSEVIAPVMTPAVLAGEKEEIGKNIMVAAIKQCPRPVLNWLADMNGLPPEQYDQQPMSKPLDDIEELINQGGLRSFFTQLLSLFALVQTE